MPMGESDRDLIRHLADSNAEIGKSLYQVHGVVSSVHERLEHFIQAHAAHVHQQELRNEAHDERQTDHSRRIDEYAGKILAYEAQLRLTKWVLGFVGSGLLVAAISAVAKAVAK